MESPGDLILFIDDNQDLLDIVATALRREGYAALAAADGRTGLEMFRQYHPALVILDIFMPGMSDWEVCQRLREFSDVPIILLTVMNREGNIVRGLNQGADDYVTKPFSIRELLSRVKAILRRVAMEQAKKTDTCISAGDLLVLPGSHQAMINGRAVKLTPIELRLLTALVEKAGRVVSYGDLLTAVWGEACWADPRQLKVYVYYLRQKLEDDPHQPRYILNERGTGYRLVVPEPS